MNDDLDSLGSLEEESPEYRPLVQRVVLDLNAFRVVSVDDWVELPESSQADDSD